MGSNLPSMEIDIEDRDSWRVVSPFVRVVRKKQAVSRPFREPVHHVLNVQSLEEAFRTDQDVSDYISDPKLLLNTAETMKNCSRSIGCTLYLSDDSFTEIKMVTSLPFGQRHAVNWKIETGSTVAAYCAHEKTYVLLEDIATDNRFPERLGYVNATSKSVLCVPIMTPNRDCLGVIEMVRGFGQDPYTNTDVKVAVAVTGWMGTALQQNKQKIELRNQKKIHDCLLNLIKCFFLNDLSLTTMIEDIVKLAKFAVNAHKGAFYVIDANSENLTADVYEEGVGGGRIFKKNMKINLRKEDSIPGMVARDGRTLNVIHNIGEDHKYINKQSGVIQKSALATPIISGNEVIGIIEVVNKIQRAEGFTKNDEAVFNIIAVYCGLALHYDYLRRSLNSNIYLDECYVSLLYKHMKPCLHEISDVQQHFEVPYPPDFDEFHWMPTEQNIEFLPQYSIFIFMSIIGEEHLNHYSLLHFVLTVKKMYRANPYHNFKHAFWVLHTMYNILIRNMNKFSVIERYGLIIAAFCHDIDHRGFTNNFLALTKDNLASLYRESTMEYHHFTMTKMILKDVHFLKNITPEEYEILEREIKDNILATDIALHFKIRSKLQQLIKDQTFDWTNETHRTYLKAVMMSACDLSHNAKPFFVSKLILLDLYKEFYQQGDIEKSLGLSPLSFMDRDKVALIPDDQIQFLNVLPVPCFQMLADLLPNTVQLLKMTLKLKQSWMEIVEMKGSKHWKQFESLVSHK